VGTQSTAQGTDCANIAEMVESPEIESARSERYGDPSRLIAFTDGVFAIVITILVLEIRVPDDLPARSLGDAIDDVGPTFTAWIISFFITGMHWLWHRDLFNQVRTVNRDVIWLNLVYMLPVCLVPFASSVLGEYHDEAIALHLYGSVLIAASLFRVILYAYLMHRPELLWEPPSRQRRRFGMLLALASVAVYVIAIVVATALPTVSLLIYLAVPLLYFVLVTALRDRPATSRAADDYS
jgi:uncharacterized membrane protein